MTLTLSPQTQVELKSADEVHPLKSNARILLTSVFGPYAQDDQFGSRVINPMELLHNQVTRVQGPFSMRMFHRSWGILFIAANINAPCTCLDFPTLDRFVEELKTHQYNVIGITSILANLGKVKHMCDLIREHQPHARIVIGGHLAALEGLADRIDADHIVRGEGVRWFRHYLGEDEDAPVRHPYLWSSSNYRVMGVPIPEFIDDIPATLIPSVGCPMGCNFCSTSHMFGGKGKFVNFFPTGDALFELMCAMEREQGVKTFFVMDENFLLDRKRALRLLELMQKHEKAWSFYLFSSANALRSYTMEQLVGFGIVWVWLGLEGEESQYSKLHHTDSRTLVRELREHGIRVLGSSIIGLETHSPQTIDEAIDYAVSHETEMHQFMLYTPLPGTPLHKELSARGVVFSPNQFPESEIHGQQFFNYRHPLIPPGQEAEMILRAFTRDYETNGPSMLRTVRTTLNAWQKYRNHPEARIRRRIKHESRGLATLSPAGIWAGIRFFEGNETVQTKLRATLEALYKEFPVRARLVAPLIGRILLATIRREAKRLQQGQTFEPPTYYDENDAATKFPKHSRARHRPSPIKWVLPTA